MDSLTKLTSGDALFKAVVATFCVLLTYLLPGEGSRAMGIVAFVFVLLDTATGIHASYVSGKPISSARMGRVFTKLVGYGSVVIVASLTAKSIPGLGIGLQEAGVSLALGLIIAREALSILENVHRMGVHGVSNRLKRALEGYVTANEEPAEREKEPAGTAG